MRRAAEAFDRPLRRREQEAALDLGRQFYELEPRPIERLAFHVARDAVLAALEGPVLDGVEIHVFLVRGGGAQAHHSFLVRGGAARVRADAALVRGGATQQACPEPNLEDSPGHLWMCRLERHGWGATRGRAAVCAPDDFWDAQLRGFKQFRLPALLSPLVLEKSSGQRLCHTTTHRRLRRQLTSGTYVW